ncbi:MAG: hypothetical protein ABJE66_20275 [Deltaproteobacteria bacterium]
MQKHWCVWVAVAGLGVAAACTKQVNVCHQDSDCGDVAYPFCDVDGQYAASGGDKGVCTIVPPDCTPERCGCTPGAETCASGSLTVCNADGHSVTTTACELGCAPDSTRCGTFAPSNGLADALAMAANEPAFDFPALADINDGGSIHEDSSGMPVAVKSFTVAQVGVPPIRVYVAHSFKIHAANLVATAPASSSPIAFVADGPIVIDGKFDGALPIRFPAPGNQVVTAPCTGVDGERGGGGGGNGADGGRGSQKAQLPPAPGAAGGPAQPVNIFEPLVGGCAGGGDGTGMQLGGVGGPAFEFVSGTSITVAAMGIVNVAGQGGDDDSGGGAGGNVVFESPMVALDGRVTANGGSGGACGTAGNPGPIDATAAVRVGGCMAGNGVGAAYSGRGGTATDLPGDGATDTGSVRGGGGGGAVGRVEIKTRDGMYEHGSAAIISAKISTGVLVAK